jgi:hypothetical protein
MSTHRPALGACRLPGTMLGPGTVMAMTRRARLRSRSSVAATAFLALLPLVGAGCFPQPVSGSLAPTLTMQSVSNGQIAVQDGIAVPTFDFQPRPRLDLDGLWRWQRASLDTDLSLTDRSTSLSTIEQAAGGRQLSSYDDSGWSTIAVPGTIDPAPTGVPSGS